ncbi:hypothetical protein DM01DRAFT_1308706 [Hesseltinella vesiculosa]|uniref:Cation efflux protein transmembrane domain-containing protein n=1 Tax=Hesseltinella vesiculosa TaxID=101127 RepID=A0A1X2GBH7_9FUNG|nr:hypothetical protein DM01DRAFT_1308706 [Hesseltinella vesiculosa]
MSTGNDKLRLYAIIISVISVIYNGAEGGVSVGFGGEAQSNSLLFFGVQSFVEVASAVLVVYIFVKNEGERDIKKEQYATIGIGILFCILTLGTWITSALSLAKHQSPDTAMPSIIISSSALCLMILIWAPKPWLAKRLNSSVMYGEARCSLACIFITLALLTGTLIYKFWKDGWWVDSALAIILGVFFAKESYSMLKWGFSSEFTGGCCQKCSKDTQ